MDNDHSPFRRQALESVATPKPLDELVQMPSVFGWLPLLAVGIMMLAVLAWLLLGSVSTTVSGRGILIGPQNALIYLSAAEGQRLKSGMTVIMTPMGHDKPRQFKTILGKITTINFFPVPFIHRSLNEYFSDNKPVIVALVTLTPSPQDYMQPGMLVNARVILRRETPYSLLMNDN